MDKVDKLNAGHSISGHVIMNIRKSAVNYSVGNAIERRQATAWDLIPNYQTEVVPRIQTGG